MATTPPSHVIAVLQGLVGVAFLFPFQSPSWLSPAAVDAAAGFWDSPHAADKNRHDHGHQHAGQARCVLFPSYILHNSWMSEVRRLGDAFWRVSHEVEPFSVAGIGSRGDKGKGWWFIQL